MVPISTGPEPPDGFDWPPGSAARRHWGGLTLTRAAADWSPGDLRLLAETAALDAEIERTRRVLNSSGPLLAIGGRVYESPAVATFDKLLRLRLALSRALGLVSRDDADGRAAYRRRQAEREGAALTDLFSESDGLLASPDDDLRH